MGTVKKLKNGKFRTTVYDINGKRYRMTFDKKSEADAFISKREAEKHESKLVHNKLKKARYEMSTAITNYLDSKNDLRSKTLKKYMYFVKQLRTFCDVYNIKYVDDFTQDLSVIFLELLTRVKKDPKGSTDRLLKPMPRTVNYYLTRLRSFFNTEVGRGHIVANPMVNISNLRVEKKPPEYYSKKELENFFAQPMQPAYRNAFTILLHSGMRFAELANLTWEDVDLENKLILVRPKEGFKTKTYNSIRSIVMDQTLVKLFTELYKDKGDSPLVCLSVEGKKLRERLLYYRCNVIGTKAGVKGTISLHKFRHTFASMLVQHNTRIEVVQKLLGHSSIKETMIYAHIKPEDLHADVKIMDELFGQL